MKNLCQFRDLIIRKTKLFNYNHVLLYGALQNNWYTNFLVTFYFQNYLKFGLAFHH